MNIRSIATLPAQDLDRAKRWYEEKLGLRPSSTDATGGLMYEVSGGTGFLVFMSSGKANGEHTQMALEVEDVPAAVQEFKGRGVKFEDYDMPGLKTEGGIGEANGVKAAWCKDSEGNLLAVGEPVRAPVARS
jgi:predicted enzyme related to lactoylglutathione lyase